MPDNLKIHYVFASRYLGCGADARSKRALPSTQDKALVTCGSCRASIPFMREG